MNRSKWVWLFLLVGILIRFAAINQPILDYGVLRQTQTASVTRSLMDQPEWSISSIIPWQGDLPGRFVQEMPIYNYLSIGVNQWVGNLDISSKVVSIFLWAVGFLILQMVWRQLGVSVEQQGWANLLFVFSPMSIFLGQAVMPEMLVQAIAFSFVVLMLRYRASPTFGGWVLCVVAGMIGLLLKAPAIAHLYVILIAVLWSAEGKRMFYRPRYLLAGILTLVVLKLWGGYVDSINLVWIPDWSSAENLRGFIGTMHDRINPKSWILLAAYISSLLLPGIALLIAGWGFWRIGIKEKALGKPLNLWLLATVIFYLMWMGNGANKQSYYNLPALAPFCALFGMGAERLVRSWGGRRWMKVAMGLAIVGFCAPGTIYYFKQDRTIYAAARWVKAGTQPDDVIFYLPNHRWDMIDYPYNPTLSYYAQRKAFVCVRNTPVNKRTAYLDRANYALVTLPKVGETSSKWQRLRSGRRMETPDVAWILEAGFKEIYATPEFVVYKKQFE